MLPDKATAAIVPAILQQAVATLSQQQLQAVSRKAGSGKGVQQQSQVELELLQLLATGLTGMGSNGSKGGKASSTSAGGLSSVMASVMAEGASEAIAELLGMQGSAAAAAESSKALPAPAGRPAIEPPPDSNQQQHSSSSQARAAPVAAAPQQQTVQQGTSEASGTAAQRQGLAARLLGCGDALHVACPCCAHNLTGYAPLYLLDTLVSACTCTCMSKWRAALVVLLPVCALFQEVVAVLPAAVLRTSQHNPGECFWHSPGHAISPA